MDFVAGWKAVSVGLTAVFGLLGLLTEFKHKETGKITGWGKLALLGILTSGVMGVIAQLKESSDQEISRKATAQETLSLVHQTGQAVRDVQRVLSPLDTAYVEFSFEVPCSSSKYQAFCSRINKLNQSWKPASLSDWDKWPGGLTILPLDLDFFTNAKDAQVFGSTPNSTTTSDLQISIITDQRDKNLWAWRRDDMKIVINGKSSDFARTKTNGRIKSILDLPGTMLLMTQPVGDVGDVGDENTPRLDELKLVYFEITLKNSQTIEMDINRFEIVAVAGKPAYRYLFK